VTINKGVWSKIEKKCKPFLYILSDSPNPAIFNQFSGPGKYIDISINGFLLPCDHIFNNTTSIEIMSMAEFYEKENNGINDQKMYLPVIKYNNLTISLFNINPDNKRKINIGDVVLIKSDCVMSFNYFKVT
jgi:hypothetical protein